MCAETLESCPEKGGGLDSDSAGQGKIAEILIFWVPKPDFFRGAFGAALPSTPRDHIFFALAGCKNPEEADPRSAKIHFVRGAFGAAVSSIVGPFIFLNPQVAKLNASRELNKSWVP